MKVERWEEEPDEDWAERLAEEIELANNTETTKYFVERDSYAEENFIINYIGKTGWTWKEHPEGPFSCKQVLEWKLKAEKMETYKRWWDIAMDANSKHQDKLEAVKTWMKENFDIEYQLTEEDEYSLAVTNTAMLEIWKILEGEEVQSSDTTTRIEK